MDRARVLVVDDKENILGLSERILGDAYQLTTAADGQRAISLLAGQDFDVIVTDLRMPGADGFEVLRAARSRSPDTEVIVMTAYATVQDAVDAMKQGAYDYLQKPFDPDDASLVVARALERRRLRAQTQALRGELEGVYSFHSLVGKSPAMRDLYQLLDQFADGGAASGGDDLQFQVQVFADIGGQANITLGDLPGQRTFDLSGCDFVLLFVSCALLHNWYFFL